MNIRIVTTFNPRHWSEYAHRNLQSMLDFLPYELVAYYESEQPDLEHHRLVWRCLDDVPGCLDFVAESSSFPPARGMLERYDYNFDVHKFCRKVYAQCDAAEEGGADVLIWLDSDVEVLAPLSGGEIETLLNGQPMATYQRHNMHTETGIVFWDMRRPECAEFFKHYRHLYDSRRIYTVPGGWHDCWALDAVVHALRLVPTQLSRHPERLEVVSTSELGKVFRHDKGSRKYADGKKRVA